MIGTAIVLTSAILAAVFVVAWLRRPELRRQIEYPKHCFQDQVREYDRQCRGAHAEIGGDSNESQQAR